MTRPSDVTDIGPAPAWSTDPARSLREGALLWICGCQAWTFYLLGLTQVRRADDLIALNANLAANMVELCERAAGEMRRADARAPSILPT